MIEMPLPPELRALFADGGAGRSLTVPLPPGRAVRPADEETDQLIYWLSDTPATAELWARLRAEHATSGLWPLLLGGLDGEEDRPWIEGELYPEDTSTPGDHDPAALLADWWRDHTETDEEDMLTPEDRREITAPYGLRWPGLAPQGTALADPDDLAAEYAAELLRTYPTMRLGLVAADRGADTLTVTGWSGPANYIEVAELSAVLRSWEHRFGARVVGVGYDTLHLSVAAPPTTVEQALHVAAEHFACCPDNIWQEAAPQALAAYADELVGTHDWEFWWD